MTHLMELALLFLAGWAFWPILLLVFVIFWATSENEMNIWAIISLGVLIALTNYHFDYLAAFNTWYKIVGFIVAYAIIGGAYSFMRWYLFLRGKQTIFLELRDAFLKENKLPENYFRTALPATVETSGIVAVDGSAAITIPPEVLQENARNTALHNAFMQKIGNSSLVPGFLPKSVETVDEAVQHIIPVANEHKALIVARIAYWPTSLLWFIVSDFVVEAANTVYRIIGGRYQKLANSMFKSVL